MSSSLSSGTSKHKKNPLKQELKWGLQSINTTWPSFISFKNSFVHCIDKLDVMNKFLISQFGFIVLVVVILLIFFIATSFKGEIKEFK